MVGSYALDKDIGLCAGFVPTFGSPHPLKTTKGEASVRLFRRGRPAPNTEMITSIQMKRKQLKAQLRAEAIEEAHRDEDSEIRAQRTFLRWRRATALLGVLSMASVVALALFLAGGPLHNHWEKIGKKVLVLSGVLFGSFIYTAAHTWIYWYGLRELRKIHKRYAPPGSKYRTGKGDPADPASLKN